MLAEIGKLSAKRHWLKAIRGLLRSAIPTMRVDDPTEGIANIKLPKSKGHHTCVRRQRSLDRPGGLNKGEFLAHRNVHRSEDETANPSIEGTS
jgi:hypothetical protein